MDPSDPFHVVAVDDGEEAGSGGSDEADRRKRRLTSAPEWLQDVLGKRDGGDGVAGGYKDEEGNPEVEKGGEGAEGLTDVGVIAAGFWDHCA